MDNICTIHDEKLGVRCEMIAYNYDHLDRLETALASGVNGYARV